MFANCIALHCMNVKNKICFRADKLNLSLQLSCTKPMLNVASGKSTRHQFCHKAVNHLRCNLRYAVSSINRYFRQVKLPCATQIRHRRSLNAFMDARVYY